MRACGTAGQYCGAGRSTPGHPRGSSPHGSLRLNGCPPTGDALPDLPIGATLQARWWMHGPSTVTGVTCLGLPAASSEQVDDRGCYPVGTQPITCAVVLRP